MDTIQRVKLQSDDRDIHIDCPCCDMWEQLGVDDPRKRLNVLPIIAWKPNYEVRGLEYEVTLNKCTQCDTEFEVEWDYDNPLK